MRAGTFLAADFGQLNQARRIDQPLQHKEQQQGQ